MKVSGRRPANADRPLANGLSHPGSGLLQSINRPRSHRQQKMLTAGMKTLSARYSQAFFGNEAGRALGTMALSSFKLARARHYVDLLAHRSRP